MSLGPEASPCEARVTSALLAALLAGCVVQLNTPVPQDPIECVDSSSCPFGHVCQRGYCEVSDAPCSSLRPDGYCPANRVCVPGGVCVTAGTVDAWCDCQAYEQCFAGECVTTGVTCSLDEKHGACPQGEVCVGGTCTDIVVGVNACAPDRPQGLCPHRSACSDGFCVPTNDDRCSAENPGGTCSAGDTCQLLGCAPAVCSPTVPFGACALPEHTCVDGACLSGPALQQCIALGCPQSFRVCDTTGAAPACGGCLPTHVERFGACVPQDCAGRDCASEHRACQVTGDVAVCTECLPGFADTGTGCMPQTCANIAGACAAQHRVCVEGADGAPATCGACDETAGFTEVAGACVAVGCADTPCAAQHRECNPTTPPTCGGCLEGFTENGAGNCVACETTAQCPVGHFCSAGACLQECNAAQSACGANLVCTPHGQCVPDAPNGAVCAAGLQHGLGEEPTVMLVIDQSGSMTEEYGDTTRWAAVSNALFGPSGIVTRWEGHIRFGLALFSYDFVGDGQTAYNCCDPGSIGSFACASGTYPGQSAAKCVCGVDTMPRSGDEVVGTGAGFAIEEQCLVANACIDTTLPGCAASWSGQWWSNCISDTCDHFGTTCPQVLFGDDGPSAIGNDGTPLVDLGLRDELFATFDASAPIGATPTGESVHAVVDFMETLPHGNDQFILLATDGEPDHCRQLDPNDASNVLAPQLSIDAIQRAYQAGIYTFVLAVGNDVGAEHLQDIANAGSGKPPELRGADATVASEASDPAALLAAMRDIIDRVLACEIHMESTGLPSAGQVFLDGDLIPTTAWTVLDANTVQILDPYCEILKDDGQHFVSVQFDTCN